MNPHKIFYCSGAAAMAGIIAVSAAAGAAADPLPPVDPAAPAVPAASGPPAPLTGPAVSALGPLGAIPGLAGSDFLLSQYPVPSAPGGVAAAPPNFDVLNAAQFLNPLNYRVPTPERVPDQVSPYVLAPATDPGPFARVEALKGQHAMLQGALGRMPIGELSTPLDGTAPPPGSVIPAGPEQNLPDPVLPNSALPGLVLPPPAPAPPG